MKKNEILCDHKHTEKIEIIQEGYPYKFYQCLDCGEVLDDWGPEFFNDEDD